METIIIKDSYKEEFEKLLEYLESLDDVKVDYSEDLFSGMPVTRRDPNNDPSELVGLWKGSDVTLEKIRKGAWRDLK